MRKGLLTILGVAVPALVSAAARAEIVTLVCPFPTYTETVVIDFADSTIRSSVDLSPAAGHKSPVRAEITDQLVRFQSPNGQFVDTINRLTLEYVLGASGMRSQCQLAKPKI